MALPLKKASGVFDAIVGVTLVICSLGGLANSTPTFKTIAFLFFGLAMGGYMLVSGARKLKAR